jgi:hypothetical protein
MPSPTLPRETPTQSKEIRPVNVVNVALKAKYAFYSTLVFFLVANPETLKLTQRLLGGFITLASESGCPTAYGFFSHSLLFFLILWGMMLFPRDL